MTTKTVTVTATAPLTYQGRSIVVGESFQARPADAASLHYQRKVSLTRPRRVLTRDVVPESGSDTDETPRRRRNYRRRDMVPEP